MTMTESMKLSDIGIILWSIRVIFCVQLHVYNKYMGSKTESLNVSHCFLC